ncbi:MAG: Stk1 family PASTA domain-containing Ser/Thr kinase [Chloroflexi bacterium]|nr:Stk1 family PASTA domain-containing Ser/Thr kinase [Chloroflexota bacterium]
MAQQVVLNNRYRILGLVGEGGMAKVYKAEDRLLERAVAVKVLREQYASDEAFVERFRQEARSAAGLAHPNIVSVYDVGIDGTWNYIVMEYVEGPSLKELILQGAPFTNARAVDIGLQILSALSFAHQKGLVHRDVKPQNILIAADGAAKVTDFGIARAATGTQLTETGVVLGTVHYFSPEQARGEIATPASDLYSVGIILYEMLTGRLPFQGDSTLGIALKHVQEQPTSPRTINPRIPPSIESIIVKAMAKEPADRYQSADVMKNTLTSYRQIGEQLTAPVNVAALSSAARGKAATLPSVASRDIQRMHRGVDWFIITLGVLIIGFLVASVPVAAKVYDLYFRSPTAFVTETPTPTPTATPAPPTATSSPVSRATVPSVIGLPYTEARQRLEAEKLQIRVVDQQNSERYQPTQVISQSEKAGAEVRPGFVVDVVVSKGPEKVAVPRLIGESRDAATSKLAAADLKARVAEDYHDAAPAGTVIDQRPGFNTEVTKGSTIDIVVSKGRSPASPTPDPAMRNRAIVPPVIGLPEEEARKRITDAGLANTYPNYQEKGDIPDDELKKVRPGSVLSQQPPPGSIVAPGTTVYLAIRKK